MQNILRAIGMKFRMMIENTELSAYMGSMGAKILATEFLKIPNQHFRRSEFLMVLFSVLPDSLLCLS